MTLDCTISGPPGVLRVFRNGKRQFDPDWKERLIDAALEPRVSVARLALEHGVNANQLRNWVKLRRRRQKESASRVLPVGAPPAFVPVVEVAPTARTPAICPVRASSARLRLKASLPNGVQLELANADAQALSAFIEVLGRCDVPAR
jgi:transposase